jgi:hypothetical protein
MTLGVSIRRDPWHLRRDINPFLRMRFGGRA